MGAETFEDGEETDGDVDDRGGDVVTVFGVADNDVEVVVVVAAHVEIAEPDEDSDLACGFDDDDEEEEAEVEFKAFFHPPRKQIE